MRVLVTGAGGMLGQDVMARAGEGSVGLARAELDIRDVEAVRAAVRDTAPQAVINCAAWTDVDGAESQEDDALAVNGTGAGHVARAAAEVGVPVVHVSTDYVFDGHKDAPYVESDPVAPMSAYGRTKLAGERAVREGNPRHHVVRSSWLFGVGGRNFVDTMLRLGREREEVSVVVDQVGCPTYTGHLADALLRIAESDAYGVWHVAGGGHCSWNELAREAFAQAGVECEVRPARTEDMKRPAPRPAWSVLGTERADAVTLPNWREGVRAYLAAAGVTA